MKPTVTIDLEEYKTLKDIESAMLQKPFITYYFQHGVHDTAMFIVNADDSIKKMVYESNRLRKERDELRQENDIARKLKETRTTKWYKFKL